MIERRLYYHVDWALVAAVLMLVLGVLAFPIEWALDAPNVTAWLERVASQPGMISIEDAKP